MRGLLTELRWRGLLHDATPGLEARLASGTPITGYIGFDPTAPSLQVGNLVPVMLLAHLQRAGGTPIVLMGGGTGLIGDPSGKQAERPLLTTEQVDDNIRKQRSQFQRFFNFGGSPNAAGMVNNADWLRSLKLVDFLRDIGKHFTLSHMLQKESVKARLEGGISYTEFSYMLLQAYDFLHLRRGRIDVDGRRLPPCELQMGGSDQWGNITAGIELIRRADGADAHGLCAPLLTTATGSKFGKTEGKSVWLDLELTPPVVFYNFWVNTDDRDVEGLLKRFTFKSQAEIASLMERHAGDPGARIPHHALALDVTSHVHGNDIANDTANAIRTMHASPGANDFNSMIEGDVTNVIDYPWNASERPKYEDLFVAATLASSKGDARRQITGKGLYVLAEGGWSVPEAAGLVTDDAITPAPTGSYILLRKGKKASGIKILKLRS